MSTDTFVAGTRRQQRRAWHRSNVHTLVFATQFIIIGQCRSGGGERSFFVARTCLQTRNECRQWVLPGPHIGMARGSIRRICACAAVLLICMVGGHARQELPPELLKKILYEVGWGALHFSAPGLEDGVGQSGLPKIRQQRVP